MSPRADFQPSQVPYLISLSLRSSHLPGIVAGENGHLFMSSLLIKPLETLPEHIAIIAAWHHQECERQGLRSTLALRRQRLQLHVQHNAIPKTLVAVLAGEPVGCVSLVRYSFSGGETALPVWLSNLFVLEALRRQGIGEALINAAISYVKQLAFTELWLSAADYTDFYHRRGWTVTRQARLGGRDVNIMRLAIDR